jgi:predicted glycosyltransferase
MRVWIDLANSPHPLLFAPISRHLTELGHEVLITARDHAQTVELARARWPSVDVIGGPSPSARSAKAATLADRVRRLRAWARSHRPDVAVSHNSYAQIVAARLCGIRTVTAMDFEYQPANHIAFRLGDAILVPEAMARDVIRKQGAAGAKVRSYPGLKEELYLGDFEPDTGVLTELGLQNRNGNVLVVARTPPSRAAYHRFDNPLFLESLKLLGAQPEVRLVVLVRHPEQRVPIAELELENCALPQAAIDSRSLMYEADLVLGAGGTMTREAALLGVPTVSIFAGRPAGVDRLLEKRGALRRVTDLGQLEAAVPRARKPRTVEELRASSRAVMKTFVEAVVQASEPARRRTS